MLEPRSTRGGAFPDLRIVAIGDLLLHEEVDLDRVARLIDRLSADGILKNPPIVASLADSDRLLLLDGANRVCALQNLDVPHILVQVESFADPDLELSHWNHVVRDIEASAVISKARELPNVRVEELAGGAPAAAAASGSVPLCTFAFDEARTLTLHGGPDLAERVHCLSELTRLYYRGGARMDRISHADFATLRRHYQHVGGLVIFPRFTKDEVRSVAEGQLRLPSGITRFRVPRRVLGFNLQVALLKSHLPLEEKGHWLDEAIAAKVAEKRVRLYEEPTFVFDE